MAVVLWRAMAMLRRSQRQLILVSAFVLAWSASAIHAADSGEATPSATATAIEAAPPPARCLERCAPGKLIFLPCMAVGAKNMAACREREIAHCVDACSRRPCQNCSE